MNLLAIDTSTEHASIALLASDQINEDLSFERSKHAEFILPMIDKLLEGASLSLKELDGIVFGQGPGSFTGLRIACSVAKGLAYAQDLPLFPLSTLKAIAYGVREYHPELDNFPIFSMIDASQNQVYWLMTDNQGNPLGEEQVSSIDDIPLLAESFVVAGFGFTNYQETLNRAFPGRIAGYIEMAPSAKIMLKMARNLPLTSVNAKDAQPVYIRNQVTQNSQSGKKHG